MVIAGLFFEANSIQSYIVLGGRLRDVVGASHLIDELCGSTLDQTLRVLDVQVGTDCIFVRRAAGAFYAIFDSDSPENETRARQLAAAWSATVRHVCPGLGFNLVLEQGNNVFECVRAGTAALAGSRAQPVLSFPIGNPFVERSPRTGLPAVADTRVGPSHELVDAAVFARRKGYGTQPGDKVGDRLLEKLRQSGEERNWRFPRNLEHEPSEDGGPGSDPALFPFTAESRYLAVIHADANGLGQLLISLISRAADLEKQGHASVGRQYKELLPKLSETIEDCMVGATVSAIATVLLPAANSATLPARPLVLAGDDLSMLVRADLALPFMREVLQTFEKTSAVEIGRLASNPQFKDFADLLKQGLTACAGMVFVKNNHPFTQALHIAEDLCGDAKTEAKNPTRAGVNSTPFQAASAIAFERLTESLQGQGERKLPRMKAWGVGAHSQGLPRLDKLMELASVCATIARGPLRRLLSTVEMSEAEAAQDCKRWRAIMQKTASGQLKSIDDAMADILPGGEVRENFRIRKVGEGPNDKTEGASVLPDLIDLLAVGLPPAHDIAKGEGA